MIKAYNVEVPADKRNRGNFGQIQKDIRDFLESGANNAEIEVIVRDTQDRTKITTSRRSSYCTAIRRMGFDSRCKVVMRENRLFIIRIGDYK